MAELTKNPISTLQELAAKKKLSAPNYVFREIGTENKSFQCEVFVADIQVTAIGYSKRLSKHEAASKALQQLQNQFEIANNALITKDFSEPTDSSTSSERPTIKYNTVLESTKTPVMILHELTVQLKYSPPVYNITFQQINTHQNRFDYEVHVAGICALGTGSSKKVAKHDAAYNALVILKEKGIYDASKEPVSKFKPDNSNGVEHIAELQNICLMNKIPAPQFIEISCIGPPHNREFTFECKISSITTIAKASTKKMAKQFVAKFMLEKIKDVLPNLILEITEHENALTNAESDALKIYQDIREIIPDKSINIKDLPNTLAKLMMDRDLKYEDFIDDLRVPTEENLNKVLEKLELGFKIHQMQDNPILLVLSLKLDTPFCIINYGKTIDEAKSKVLNETFIILNDLMEIKVDRTGQRIEEKKYMTDDNTDKEWENLLKDADLLYNNKS